MDAVVVRAGLVLAAAATLVLLRAPTVETPRKVAPPRAQTFAERALELGRDRYGADLEVFDTASVGSLRAVFLSGSTTVAVIFRGEDVMVRTLGVHRGLERIEVQDVIGHPVIAVDETVTLNDDWRTYREYFVVGHDDLRWQMCLQIAGTDHAKQTAWKVSNWIAAEGTMYFTGHYTLFTEGDPPMRGFSFPFENGWQPPQDEGRCIDPRSSE